MSSVVTLPLADVCDFRRGLTYKKSDEVEFSRNVVLRANNINLSDHTLNFDDLRCILTAIPDEKKVKGGSLLICTASGSKSHLGKVAYIDSDLDYGFGGFMAMITPRRDLDPKYLFFLMTSPDFKGHLGKVTDGANINNLKFSDIKDFPVPVPPLPEQRRIVGILDQAFEGIAKAKAKAELNMANAKELIESELHVSLSATDGWKSSTLAETCEMYQPKTISAKEMIKDGAYPVFGANGQIGFYDKYNHEEPEILVTCRGATCGTVNVSLARSWVTGNAMVVRPKNKDISKEFLKWALIGQVDLLSSITGSAQPQITRSSLNPLQLHYPEDKVTQDKLCERMKLLSNYAEKISQIYRSKICEIKNLRTTLLHQAFSGNL